MKLAASYVRVSTEEQAMRGYSIEAQRDAIRKYAKENGYRIVAEYADEGVSGKKPYNKRPALSRFMSDIQGGMKVDALLFCKLDRFYRSVKLYYQAAEILERYGVTWKAILEDYETETANGRLKVNMMLTIAENEADRTSERIKFVFDSKIAQGYAIHRSTPMGYKLENHKYVIDPEKAEVARALFRAYLECGSATAAIKYVYETYGISLRVQVAFSMLRNRMYIGEYRGMPRFCEALIPESEFEQTQALLKKRGVRQNQSDQTYIFSGLVVCGECGRRMAGCRYKKPAITYKYYRCNRWLLQPGSCTRKGNLREEKLEDWLLKNVCAELESQRVKTEADAAERRKKSRSSDRAAILRKLDRLKDLYVNELVELEQYRADYERYAAQLAELDAAEANQPKVPDFQKIRKQLEEMDAFYPDWSEAEKQIFWRSVIREIRVDPDNQCHIFFK